MDLISIKTSVRSEGTSGWREEFEWLFAEIQRLSDRVRELERGVEEWHALKQKDWAQFTLYDDRLYALLKGEEGGRE